MKDSRALSDDSSLSSQVLGAVYKNLWIRGKVLHRVILMSCSSTISIENLLIRSVVAYINWTFILDAHDVFLLAD